MHSCKAACMFACMYICTHACMPMCIFIKHVCPFTYTTHLDHASVHRNFRQHFALLKGPIRLAQLTQTYTQQTYQEQSKVNEWPHGLARIRTCWVMKVRVTCVVYFGVHFIYSGAFAEGASSLCFSQGGRRDLRRWSNKLCMSVDTHVNKTQK